MRPKLEIAWVAERMKITVVWNEMYGFDGSGGGFIVCNVRLSI